MTRELKKYITELKKCLYPNNEETNNVDKVNLDKALFELLRECLKTQNYTVEVGSYIININPAELSVSYETPSTTVEVSNEDVYYETIREIPIRYFCITKEEQNEYPNNNPIIRTLGMVTNIDGIMEETYDIELFTNYEDNVRNYIDIKNGFTLVENQDEDPYAISVKRRITPNDYFTRVESLLRENTLVPVICDLEKEKYILDKEHKNDLTYGMLLPSLDDKKQLVSYLYSRMVEFYTKYI